jgi:GT2 family glycosyltransferase
MIRWRWCASRFPQVHCLVNNHNPGFAGGNNQAIRASSSEYVLLLNPDTEVKPGALAALVDFLDSHPAAGGRFNAAQS